MEVVGGSNPLAPTKINGLRKAFGPFSFFSPIFLLALLHSSMAEIPISTWRKRPPNLKRRLKAGVWYFSYIDPVTKKERGLGTDFEAARQAVAVLNDRRMSAPVQKLVERIERPQAMWHQVLDDYVEFWRVDAKPGDKTLKTARWRVGKIKRGIPDQDFSRLGRQQLAELLEREISLGDHNRYRDLIDRACRYGVSKGYRDDNPAALLLKRAKVDRQRARITAEQYLVLYAHASPHLGHAMELVRLSLQRPDDLCRLQLAEAWDGERLLVVQGKTGTRLAIRPHAVLRAAIEAAARYRIAGCPALLCYQAPRRAINHRAKDKFARHWAQCTREMLQREFAELMSRHFPALENAPTLYECKSLGVALYEEAGWQKAQIQALAGHSDIATTEIYTRGHEHYAPVDVSALPGS
ncbi:MAG TPA: tyrosine-type recombinase/integrase [Steroidobacteraceae bacterium]|nr:tyrosine-type recombinase/integrase [Steroidobacteraceae bacterium]